MGPIEGQLEEWTSIVDALEPGHKHEFYIHPHRVIVVALAEHGFHSGRRRHLVACFTCSALLHVATTGWKSRIAQHLTEKK